MVAIEDITGLNGCPRSQPCINNCEICTFFLKGDKVRIVNANYIGYEAVVTESFGMFPGGVSVILNLGNGSIPRYWKLSSTLRKMIDENDIQFHVGEPNIV